MYVNLKCQTLVKRKSKGTHCMSTRWLLQPPVLLLAGQDHTGKAQMVFSSLLLQCKVEVQLFLPLPFSLGSAEPSMEQLQFSSHLFMIPGS